MNNKSTRYAHPGEVERNWVLVDADGATLGRLATQVAMILRGKLTGNKAEHKSYWRYSGWLGGLKTEGFKEAMEKHPERVIEHAVKGMLPKNSLGRKQFTKLKVYAGPEHPHTAQNPTKIDLEA